MVNKASAFLLAVGLSAVLAGAAHAQGDDSGGGGSGGGSAAPVARPITVKLGILAPDDSNTRDFSGDIHAELGVSYDIGRTQTADPLFYGAYADYIFESSKTFNANIPEFDNGGNFLGTESFSDTGRSSAFGIGIQGRYLLRQEAQYGGRHRHGGGGGTPYIGAGVGVYSVYAKESVSDLGILPSGDVFDLGSFDSSHTTTGLGGKLMLGMQDRGGLVEEISYQWLPKNENLNLSGPALSLGYRF